MTRLAAHRILQDETAPEEFKAWLRANLPEAQNLDDIREFAINTRVGPSVDSLAGLSYWAVHPDVRRNTQVPLFGNNEGKMHFIDLEFFNVDPAKRTYQLDGSGKPGFGDVPRDKTNRTYVEAGYLPLRIEQCYDELVKAMADGRVEGDDASTELDNAVAWGGYLAHYLQDNTQPHHATADYKSETYFPGGGYKPNVHGMMEYGFLDDEEMAYPDLREAYFEQVIQQLDGKAAEAFGDPFDTSLQTSFAAYDYLPLVGEAAVAAVEAGSAREPDLRVFANARVDDGSSVLEVKAQQAATAVLHTEAAWRQAWAEATGEYERPDDHRTAGVSKPTTAPATK